MHIRTTVANVCCRLVPSCCSNSFSLDAWPKMGKRGGSCVVRYTTENGIFLTCTRAARKCHSGEEISPLCTRYVDSFYFRRMEKNKELREKVRLRLPVLPVEPSFCVVPKLGLNLAAFPPWSLKFSLPTYVHGCSTLEIAGARALLLFYSLLPGRRKLRMDVSVHLKFYPRNKRNVRYS